MPEETADAERRRNVFVVYGRNEAARLAMFDFLRSLGLNPIEWARARALTGEASPYIGTILDSAFNAAQAVVVLFTPDEIVRLRPEYATSLSDPELNPATQSRPNVLFEAGMAIGRDAKRTILVELGRTRGLSDLTGRYVVRMSDEVKQRQELAGRLKEAGCSVDLEGTDWHLSGHFDLPDEPDLSPDNGGSRQDHGSSGSGPSSEPSTDGWTKSGQLYLRVNEPKSAGFGLYTVLGEARNIGPVVQIGFLTATYRDSAGNIIGSASGAVSQLDEGETKTFTLNSNDDLSRATQWQVQTDSTL